MRHLALEFYGEKATILLPSNLKALRKEISNQFLFNEEDTEELIIKANIEPNRNKEPIYIFILSEYNYHSLLLNHIEVSQLIIEVHEKSQLYSESKAKVLLEQQRLEDQLVSLKLDTLELINNEKDEYARGVNEYTYLKTQLDEMKSHLLQFSQEVMSRHTTQKRLIRKNKKAIEALESAVHPSIITDNNNIISGLSDSSDADDIHTGRLKDIRIDWFKSTGRKRKKKPLKNKETKTNEKMLHKQIKCDGCNMLPIQGIRYKCSVCDNFNYCQRCRNKFGYMHHHTFIGIPIPTTVINPIHFEFLAPYSSLNKIIQCKYRQDSIQS